MQKVWCCHISMLSHPNSTFSKSTEVLSCNWQFCFFSLIVFVAHKCTLLSFRNSKSSAIFSNSNVTLYVHKVCHYHVSLPRTFSTLIKVAEKLLHHDWSILDLVINHSNHVWSFTTAFLDFAEAYQNTNIRICTAAFLVTLVPKLQLRRLSCSPQ